MILDMAFRLNSYVDYYFGKITFCLQNPLGQHHFLIEFH